MFELIEKIFWKVAANKIKLKLGETQRNPFTKKLFAFINNVIKKFDETDNLWIKGALIFTPLVNLFIFAGLATFIFVIVIDIFYISYVMKK